MRWLRKGTILLAVSASWAVQSPVSQAGWITLASGRSGSSQLTDTSEFWYGSSSTPLVAVDALTGTGTIQAATGGGRAFFAGSGVPVLLNLSDGSASLTGGSPPSDVTPRGPAGTAAGALASAAPQAGGSIPIEAAQLGLTLASDGAGAWVLTASVLGTEGARSGSVVVPEGGWWVLGLGAGPQSAPEPVPVPVPEPVPEPPSSPPGVPEPTAAALVASGVLLMFPWLRRKGRTNGARQ